MSQTTYPLGMPKSLLTKVRGAAEETGLSVADVMRLAIERGLPQVRRGLSKEDDIMAEALADTWFKLGPAPEIIWDKLPPEK